MMLYFKPIKGASKGMLFSTMKKDSKGNFIVDENDFITITLLQRHGAIEVKK